MSELVAESPKTKLVDRLRESRRMKEKFDRMQGENCCCNWIRRSDESAELAEQIERLLKAKEHLDQHGSDCIADLVASHLLDTTCFNDKDEFWQEFASRKFADVTDAFAEGFLNKAVEIAAQADVTAD